MLNIYSNLEKVVFYSVIIQEGKKDTKNHKFANEFDRRKTIISYNGQKYEVMFEVGRKDEINTLYGIEHIKRKK